MNKKWQTGTMHASSAVHIIGGLTLHIVAGENGLVRVGFGDAPVEVSSNHDENPLIREATLQLEAYFAGRLTRFDLPLDLRGTAFQAGVWQCLLRIPYGQTRSYCQLAAEVGVPRAARAVGAANHANPIAIIVPCHRVINSGGGLGGYGGGLDLKRRLLSLEQSVLR